MICIYSVASIKLATYNTMQLFDLEPNEDQFTQFATSDIDVFCLQELFLNPNIRGYLQAFENIGYTNSFTIFDYYPMENFIPPRTPCADQKFQNLLDSICISDYCPYNANNSATDFAGCLAFFCPNEWNILMQSECAGCINAYDNIAPASGLPINFPAAIAFCTAPPSQGGLDEPVYNLTDGLMIVSKTEYPISNTWTFDLPTWLFAPTTLNIAEINICAETDPEDKNPSCSDSIIVGCVHLETTDHKVDMNVLQSPRLDRDDITSHVGLNRYQMEKISEVFNDDILTTLGREDNADNIYGVFLMGDTNNGQLFSRCEYEYTNDEGVTGNFADNCVLPDDGPLNPFDIMAMNSFIDGYDLDYIARKDELPECTFCIDPNSEDFNPLALYSNENGIVHNFITDPDVSFDLDHIFVQEGYCKNFRDVKYERMFTDKISCPLSELFTEETCDGFGIDLCGSGCKDDKLCCDDGCGGKVCVDAVPASDHYGVSLEIEFRTKKHDKDSSKQASKSYDRV